MFENMNCEDAHVAHEVGSNDVNMRDKNEWVVNLDVQGKCLPLEINTGARSNMIRKTTLDKLNVPHVVEPSSTVVMGVHGESKIAEGVVILPCL